MTRRGHDGQGAARHERRGPRRALRGRGSEGGRRTKVVWTIEAMGGRGLAKEMVAALRRSACRWRIGVTVWLLRSGGGSGRRRLPRPRPRRHLRSRRRRAGLDLGVGGVRARVCYFFDGVADRRHRRTSDLVHHAARRGRGAGGGVGLGLFGVGHGLCGKACAIGSDARARCRRPPPARSPQSSFHTGACYCFCV